MGGQNPGSDLSQGGGNNLAQSFMQNTATQPQQTQLPQITQPQAPSMPMPEPQGPVMGSMAPQEPQGQPLERQRVYDHIGEGGTRWHWEYAPKTYEQSGHPLMAGELPDGVVERPDGSFFAAPQGLPQQQAQPRQPSEAQRMARALNRRAQNR